MKVRISQSRDRAGEAGFNYSRRQTHRAKEDCEMSVAVITGTSNLNPLEVDVAKVAVVELDPRTRRLVLSENHIRI